MTDVRSFQGCSELLPNAHLKLLQRFILLGTSLIPVSCFYFFAGFLASFKATYSKEKILQRCPIETIQISLVCKFS